MSTDESPVTGGPTTAGPPVLATEPTGPGRSRRLVGGIVSAVASRGVAAIAPLLLVPITFDYLGTSVYGLWMAIVSLTSMAVWADLGLGNGLMTRLSHAVAADDLATGRRLIASAYVLLIAFALPVVALVGVISPVVPWETALNITDPEANGLAARIALVTLGAFLLNVPLSLIQRIQYAHQEVTRSNVWVAVGSLTSVLLGYFAVRADVGVLWVVGLVALGPLLGNLLNTLSFFLRHPYSRPSRSDVSTDAARSLVGLGGQFLVVTLLSAIALNLDTILVAHTSSLEVAAVFAVAVRAMTALGLLVTLVNLPLWPANAEAIAKGDLAWVERTTRKMAWLSSGAVLVVGTVVGFASDPLFSLWLGKATAVPSARLVLLLAVWWTLAAAVVAIHDGAQCRRCDPAPDGRVGRLPCVLDPPQAPPGLEVRPGGGRPGRDSRLLRVPRSGGVVRPPHLPSGCCNLGEPGVIAFLRAVVRSVTDRVRGARDPEAFARAIGVRLDGRVRFYGISRGMFGSEPWLITIGDNVYITAGVTFVTHDGGTLILRKEYPDLEWTAPITVEDDVYIGVQAIVLPGVTIGRRSIVAAGAVVASDVAPGSVVGGVPARLICTTDEYLRKMKEKSLGLGHLPAAEKERELRRLFGREQP